MNKKPNRGGARLGAGRKPADGATGLKRYTVTIDPVSAEILRKLGSGELSVGIRVAALLADSWP